MLTQDFRPKTFSEVLGQEKPKRILRSIASNLDKAPQSIILEGEYGTGKTTLARIFARALNSNDFDGDIPEEDEWYQKDINKTPAYMEFDTTDLGVSNIREMKKDLSSSITVCNYRVICFDEIHTGSKKMQSSLLKVLEDLSRNIIFVFCTTEIDGIIDTIQSRSLVLNFGLIDVMDLMEYLQKLAQKLDLKVSKKSLYYMAVASNGHVRDAVMNLNLCNTMGDSKEFRDTIQVPEKEILQLIYKTDIDDKQYNKLIEKSAQYVLSDVRQTIEKTVLRLLKTKHKIGFDSPYYKDYERIVDKHGEKVYNFTKFFTQDWVLNCFQNNVDYASMWWSFKNLFGKKKDESIYKKEKV